MSGQVGDLSPKQETALQQFKDMVKDVHRSDYDDHFYLRWLRARQFDLKKSEKMLRDSLAWRKEWDMDNIASFPIPEVVEKYYPGGYFGEDRDGCPLWIELNGYLDVKGMAFSANRKDIIRARLKLAEHSMTVLLPEASKRHGRRIDQTAMLYDMEGIGMKHLWKPALTVYLEMLAMLEANYPEVLKKCYIVNAPAIFPIAYNLVKPILSDDTKKKLIVMGKSWKKDILKHIDPDQLPVHWGGTRTDPDGDTKCRSQICLGGAIPEHYKQTKPDVDLSKFTVQTVGRGSTIQVEQLIDTPGLILQWQFWTEGQDIGFGIFRRTADGRQKKGEMEEVLKSERVNSHIIPEDGSISCETAGTYVLRFDNTYSWVNAKKIFYTVETLKPTSLDEIHADDFVTSL